MKTVQIGPTGILFIIFLVLKLAGLIAWSWLWVFSPLWIGMLLWVLACVVIVLLSDE